MRTVIDKSRDTNSDHRIDGRVVLLVAGFLAWMFAGLENSLFILIHRQMMFELLGADTPERMITQWFAWNQAAFMLGGAAGGWLFGALGDRFGRTRALGWSVLCYSLLTLLAWFITEPHAMWLVRFLACLGFGGTWPNAVALVSEAWPSASRPLMAGVMGTAANFGFVLLGLIALCFDITESSWRWVLLVGGSPAVIGAWILVAVPESKKWLAAKVAIRERFELAQSPPGNHSSRRTGLQARSRNDSVLDGPGDPSYQRSSGIAQLFQGPLLRRTLLGISLGAVPVVGTAANANWVVPWTDQVAAKKADEAATTASSTKPKTDPKQKVRTQITRSTGAIFGSLCGGIIASLVGRRLSYFLISLLTFGVSSFLFTQLTPGGPWFTQFTFLLGLFGVTYFGWLPLFLPELFPTHVRAAGSGISFNSGRIIAAIVTIYVGLRMSSFNGDYAKIGFWTGLVYVVGMIIIWFAPKTVKAELEKST